MIESVKETGTTVATAIVTTLPEGELTGDGPGDDIARAAEVDLEGMLDCEPDDMSGVVGELVIPGIESEVDAVEDGVPELAEVVMLLSVVLEEVEAVGVLVLELDEDPDVELVVDSIELMVVMIMGCDRLNKLASLSLQQSPDRLPLQHHWSVLHCETATLPSNEPLVATPF